MNLVVDIGSTQVKVAIFELERLVTSLSFDEQQLKSTLGKLLKEHQITSCILSAVSNYDPCVVDVLQDIPFFLRLSHTTKLPFINRYSTPHTLGKDRIALVAAAVRMYAGKNVLVIDAGTCMTFDIVEGNKQYLGGAISPGLEMRYRALHDYTSNLPKLSKSEQYPLIGYNTTASIHSGVINGMVQEIEGVVGQYQKKYQDLTVVLTGGDTKFLFKQLKNSIFANQNFLLQGLNQILTYNNQE